MNKKLQPLHIIRPFPSQATTEEEDNIMQELSSPYQMALPQKKSVKAKSTTSYNTIQIPRKHRDMTYSQVL